MTYDIQAIVQQIKLIPSNAQKAASAKLKTLGARLAALPSELAAKATAKVDEKVRSTKQAITDKRDNTQKEFEAKVEAVKTTVGGIVPRSKKS
jgi:hypothetical protein